MTIKVCVCGACGRMGRLVSASVIGHPGMRIVAAVDRPDSPELGRDMGDLTGMKMTGVQVSGSDELEKTLRSAKPDVIVDFTVAEAAVRNMLRAVSLGINIVVGTTAIPEHSLERLREAVKKKGTSAVISPNMATGVNVVFELAGQLAKLLPDYDIEIVEAHHSGKLDSPSGTAMRLGEILADITGRKLRFGRHGKSERGDEIGIHAVRAGDIAGEHTVLFAGPGERIELTHRAGSREPFVKGVVKAIQFVAGKHDGKAYGMGEVLGL
ncbi:MAG: 4-hydroxy-tetrahydrodipicolinate reductase [Candidatus Aenigmarchaeota archaeon]|nr:4-hydroxy-tetrahydrodipicolinate reductase [Candidatus Aenigmarchaeota archaeon]